MAAARQAGSNRAAARLRDCPAEEADLDRRRFEPCKALLGPDRLIGGIRSGGRQRRRRSLQRRQGGRSRFRRRGWTRRERDQKSDQGQGGDAKTDRRERSEGREIAALGNNAVRRCASRLRRRRIATGFIRRRQGLRPSRVWLLPGEQDGASYFFCVASCPSSGPPCR